MRDFFNNIYPRTDFHELNLDWILCQIRLLNEKYATLTDERINWVSVKDFGAVGDGVTDDTNAFQRAINTGYDVYVPLHNSEHYLITGTLWMTYPRQIIFGDCIDRVYDEAVTLESGMGYILTQAPVTFNVTATGVRFQGLTFASKDYLADYNYKYTCIRFDARENADNADGQITDCAFYGYNRIVENYGRGLGFYRNACFHFNHAIWQSYTYDGSGGLDVQQPEYGDRAFRVVNNRFHTGNLVIENDDGLLNGALISNNVSDGGAGFISSLNKSSAGMKNCIISNNSCPICNKNQWLIIRGGKFINNIITGNTIASLSSSRSQYRFVQIEASVTDFSENSIVCNTYKHALQDSMLFSARSVRNIISGNIIADCCETNSNSISPIRFNNGLDDTIISGNELFTVDDSISRGMIQILNNPTISGNRIINNNTNLSTYVYGTYTEGSKPNVFQTS